MESFSRVLVALDNSPMDQFLVRHARKVADLFKVEKMHFVHIIPELGLPKDVQTEFLKRFASETPFDEQVRGVLEKVVVENWGTGSPSEWNLDIIVGRPYSQLMSLLDDMNIGTLVVGQKLYSSGSGINARKLAMDARCNVLFVPEKPLRPGQMLLVPVDFSENSAKALKMALQWKKDQQEVQIVALHVTDLLATGYYFNREEFESFNRFLTDTARDSFRQFLEDFKIPRDAVESVILRNDGTGIPERINAYASEKEVDWIIVGAQGHGAIERFLFGSITEKLVSKPLPAPTLVVR